MVERFSTPQLILQDSLKDSGLRRSQPKLAAGGKGPKSIVALDTSLNKSSRSRSGSVSSSVRSKSPSNKHGERKIKKKKSRASKIGGWFRRTFCGQTTAHTNVDFRDSEPKSLEQMLTADSWKEQVVDQLERQFVQAQTNIPQYIIHAQKAVQQMVRDRKFQQQAKQDQNEFKLAMQRFLAVKQRANPDRFDYVGSIFEQPEETKDCGSDEFDDGDEMQRVCKAIEDQEDKNYEDMVSDCLVQLEYDIYQQIRNQLQQKTNALFQLCRQLVKAFLAFYGHYTEIDGGKKLDRTQMRRQTLKKKTLIQNVSNQLMNNSSSNLEKTILRGSNPNTSMQDHSNDFSSHSISKFLDQSNQEQYAAAANQSGCMMSFEDSAGDEEDNSANQLLSDGPKNSLATKAVDELYILVVSFCNVIEIFFQPFYPKEVTHDLHNDFLLLVQHMMFRSQEKGKVYQCLTVLMRVDSQVDDKDLRDKMRICKEYSPLDFGVEKDFAMVSQTNKGVGGADQKLNGPPQMNDQTILSINDSGLKITTSGRQVQPHESTDTLGIQIESTSKLIEELHLEKKKTEPKIECNDVDEPSGQTSAALIEVEPYAQTIAHMQKLLGRTSAPMQKLIELAENRDILSKELDAYQRKAGLRCKIAGQDQKDLILRYILIKSNVGDLYCQRTVLEEFAIGYIKQNSDGNLLAKVYLDFISAVDFLQSLDKEMLRDGEYGRDYLQDFNLQELEDRLCLYQEDQTDEMGSRASSYNMFAGFREIDRMSGSVVSGGRHNSGNYLLTKNSLKMRSLKERHSSRHYTNSNIAQKRPSFLQPAQQAAAEKTIIARQNFQSMKQSKVLDNSLQQSGTSARFIFQSQDEDVTGFSEEIVSLNTSVQNQSIRDTVATQKNMLKVSLQELEEDSSDSDEYQDAHDSVVV